MVDRYSYTSFSPGRNTNRPAVIGRGKAHGQDGVSKGRDQNQRRVRVLSGAGAFIQSLVQRRNPFKGPVEVGGAAGPQANVVPGANELSRSSKRESIDSAAPVPASANGKARDIPYADVAEYKPEEAENSIELDKMATSTGPDEVPADDAVPELTPDSASASEESQPAPESSGNDDGDWDGRGRDSAENHADAENASRSLTARGRIRALPSGIYDGICRFFNWLGEKLGRAWEHISSWWNGGPSSPSPAAPESAQKASEDDTATLSETSADSDVDSWCDDDDWFVGSPKALPPVQETDKSPDNTASLTARPIDSVPDAEPVRESKNRISIVNKPPEGCYIAFSFAKRLTPEDKNRLFDVVKQCITDEVNKRPDADKILRKALSKAQQSRDKNRITVELTDETRPILSGMLSLKDGSLLGWVNGKVDFLFSDADDVSSTVNVKLNIKAKGDIFGVMNRKIETTLKDFEQQAQDGGLKFLRKGMGYEA